MPWARRRTPQVEVLSRDGCHLCEEMVALVREEVGQVEVRDLDAERATGRIGEAEHDRWSTELPVLLVDGVAVARWRVDREELRAALRAARGRRRSGR